MMLMNCWLGRSPQEASSYSISTAHLRYRRVYDILTDARIVARIKDLIGERGCLGFAFFCKMPGDGKRVSWHQIPTIGR